MHAHALILVLFGGLLATGEPTPAPPAATGETPASPPAPEAPAEPGAVAPDAAPVEETPAVELPPEPVVLPTIIGNETYNPPLPAELARRYRKLRLDVEDMPGGRFVVRDGQGYSLDAQTFAGLTNDLVVQDRLKEGRKEGRRDAIIVASVGGAVALSSMIPLAFLTDNDRPIADDYLLDPDDFPDEQSFLRAQAQSDAQYALALGVFNSAEGHNEDMRWTSLALVSGGTMLLFVSPTPYELAVHEQKPLYLSYTRDEAAARVEAYNRAVRARLGMPEPQPPEDAPEEAPAEAGVLAPTGTKLVIQPWIGPGSVGIHGRF